MLPGPWIFALGTKSSDEGPREVHAGTNFFLGMLPKKACSMCVCRAFAIDLEILIDLMTLPVR